MALIKCEECGRMVSDRAVSCPQCGCPVTKQEAFLICPECGNNVSKEETKCSNCGCPVAMFEQLAERKEKNTSMVDSLTIRKCPSCGYIDIDGSSPKCPCCQTDGNTFVTLNADEYIKNNADQYPYQETISKAMSGDTEAAYNIGKCYELGNGVRVNCYAAYIWYKKAALNGNTNAMIRLAYLYSGWLADDYPNSSEQAKSWCDKAVQNGCQDAYTQVADELKKWNERQNLLINQDYSAHTNWGALLQRIGGGFVLYFSILSFGANGDNGDFAQKYAQMHGVDYMNVRDYLQSDFEIFPVPKTVYYYRTEDGQKKVIGSYSFWVYSVK